MDHQTFDESLNNNRKKKKNNKSKTKGEVEIDSKATGKTGSRIKLQNL